MWSELGLSDEGSGGRQEDSLEGGKQEDEEGEEEEVGRSY